MKKNVLIVLGTMVFVALNVLAFSTASAFAYDPQPVTHGDCYQTMTTCDHTGAMYASCTSQKKSQYCTQTNSKCRPCSNEPVFFDPDGPVVGPVNPRFPGEYPGVPFPGNSGKIGDEGAQPFPFNP